MTYFLLESNKTTSKETYTQIACIMAFCVFSFAYLFFYQQDVLAAAQHVLSEGKTHYGRTVGAILITITLCLLQWGVASFVKLDKWAYALTFFPSLLVLTVITDVSPVIHKGFSFGGWWVAVPLALAVFYWTARQIINNKVTAMTHTTWLRDLWVALALMVTQFLLVGFFSNSQDVFHYRMRMESLIAEGKYDKALKVGRRSISTDASLTMLRAYALARRDMLGEQFFHYPVECTSRQLLPDGDEVCTLIISDTLINDFAKSRPASVQYRLMGYLVDRDLEHFAALAKRLYPDTIMPRHYAEAMLLYKFYSGKPIPEGENHVVETDFQNFRQVERQYPKEVAPNYLRREFGNTYWYYYKYGRRSHQLVN